MMNSIPGPYHQLNSGLPWFAYWVLNVFDMLNQEKIELSLEIKLEFVKYLKELLHKDGGFSGYSGGFPNIISTYAAILAICILGIPEAYEIIDIPKMRNFILSVKNTDYKNSNSQVDSKKEFVIKKDDKKGKQNIFLKFFKMEKISLLNLPPHGQVLLCPMKMGKVI